ncbi:MAG TPA: hypothetical protein VFQ85_01705 [Mycobacteriales bacterium]|jgi:hypothetical protein|nr:hypothetical protein [Mycobacteriales bacterium]
MSTDPDVVEPGRMQGEAAPAAANQRTTEPVPPAAQQDVPGEGSRADYGYGTSTGPGPREGALGGRGGAGGGVAAPAFSHAPEGRSPEASRPEPSGAGDHAQGPHDPGRIEADLPGEASRVPGVQGVSPDPFAVDTASGAARVQSAAASGGADSGGDAKGVPVPSETPAEGTSEAAEPVDGVRITAVAREGLADGEPDNRAPSTGVF